MDEELLITNEEKEIVNMLAECWNAYTRLPPNYNDHGTEFSLAIHRAQNIILARTGIRQLNKEE